MVKKVRVSLHGFQNRGIMVDADATDGARIGKNLYWPDGTVVTEEELRNIASGTSTSGTTIDENLLNYILANLGKGSAANTEYPLHHTVVDDPLTILADYQYIVWGGITVNETLTIEEGGELIILDRGLPDLKGPDMTYSAGDLSQIDYDDGSQKILSYTGGNLTRVDLIRDGWTLRKDLFYDVNDDLDYIDEYYV